MATEEMGLMRNRIGWLAVLVAAGGLLAPGTARAQDGNYNFEVPPPPGVTAVPTPLNPYLDRGGWIAGGEFIYFRQTNPLRSQLIGFRGLTDRDGSVSAALGIPGGPGTFIGSRAPALDVDQVSGPGTFQPGFTAFFGYRFANGLTILASWMHLTEVQQSATAGLQPPTATGNFQEETFITSPVFNYPQNYFGPGNKVGIGNVGATSGIWNASSLQTESFIQRFEQIDIGARYPLQQTECWRMYGLFGARAIIMWERFWWRTVSANVNGVVLDDWAAVYTNIVSNRMYGPQIGIGNEWLLGTSPIGAFACSLDLQAAALVDFVKGRAAYELGDRSTSAHRNRNFINLVPEVQGSLNLWWYPYAGIQLRVGYSAFALFNTMASQNPVDFNYGAIAPAFNDGITRFFHGLNAGIAFSF
jgi:hypothetical protein